MKIGIITIHKIINFGSALQAYALQSYIQKQFLSDVEIIDYIYPNKYHLSHRPQKDLRQRLLVKLREIKHYLTGNRTQKLYRNFYNEFFHLSPIKYNGPDELMKQAPVYDIYITGSDQVWNINNLHNDPAMYCCFAPDKSIIVSYGASFSTTTLPKSYYSSIRTRLNRYKSIGLREKSGIDILKDIGINNNIPICCNCDPTLLLNKSEYAPLAEKSSIKINGDYILVYLLDYAYNPEPTITEITQMAVNHYGCKVVRLLKTHFSYNGKMIVITDAGPCEFLWLFQNAKHIITSSFHGTMFSVIFRKPFTTIIPDSSHLDCRSKDFLLRVGLNKCMASTDATPVLHAENPYTDEVEIRIKELISDSQKYLKNIIKYET